jgi:hypothetical protein
MTGWRAPQLIRRVVRLHLRTKLGPMRALCAVLVALTLAGCSRDQREHPSARQASDSMVCLAHRPQFADYSVDSVYRGPLRWPVVTLGPDSLDLARRSDLALAPPARAADFAGHLAVVWWGCGSPCKQAALVDVRTGSISAIVDASLGAAYRLDSRLFVVDPPDSAGCYDPRAAYGWPVYYQWTGDSLALLWSAHPDSAHGLSPITVTVQPN